MGMIYWIMAQRLSPELVSPLAFLVNLLLLISYLVLLSWDAQTKRYGALIFLCIVILELGYNADTIFMRYQPKYTLRADYAAFRDRMKPALDEVKPQAGAPFYRVEKDPIRTYNDSMMIGYAGIGNFSSIANIAHSRLMKKLGYDCYATWCLYHGGTIVNDSLLGIRYILRDTPDEYYHAIGTKTEARPIVENPYAFPIAFYSQTDFTAFPSLALDDPFALHQALFTAITGEKKRLYREIPLTDFPQVSVPQEPLMLFFPYVSLSDDVFLNEEPVFTRQSSYTPFLVDLHQFPAGAEVKIRVDGVNEVFAEAETKSFSLDLPLFAELAAQVQQTSPVGVFDGKSKFVFDVSAGNMAARHLLTLIPYDRGWRIHVDGRQVMSASVLEGSLLGVEIPAGADKVEFSFVPEGLDIGLGLTFAGLLVFLVVVIIEKRKKTMGWKGM